MIVGYFGDGPWAHRGLRKLIDCPKVQVGFVCGRHSLKDLFLEEMARDADLPFFTFEDINKPSILNSLPKLTYSLFVSMSYDQIFSENILKFPVFGTINCHAGKLPFYRGRNVLNWALINDEKEFGITTHYVDPGIDTGDIIKQKCYPITDDDDYGSLLLRAHEACADLLAETVFSFLDGPPRAMPQSDCGAVGFYCTKRIPGDERLGWAQPSRQIFNFVRAVTKPAPGALCFLGKNEVKIFRVKLIPNAPFFQGIPGAILEKSKNGLIVKTLDSLIEVVDWECSKNLHVGDRLT